MTHIARWKIFIILGICFWGILYSLPNFLSPATLNKLPEWLPKSTVNLGLDLQGGSSILLKVDLENYVKDHLTSITDSLRQTLRKAKVGFTGLGVHKNKITLSLRDASADTDIAAFVRGIDQQLTVTQKGHQVTIAYSEEALVAKKKNAIDQSIENIRRRVDESGTKEPVIQQHGSDRIQLQMPGVSDPRHVKNLLGKTAKLSFQLVDEDTSPEDALQGLIPPGSELLEGDPKQKGPAYYAVKKFKIVTGEMLEDASATFDEYNRPAVSFRLNTLGARKFGDATKANVNKRFAIILDGKVISAPNIGQAIYGGNVQITGSFSVQETHDLSLLLRAGALPAKLTPVEERTVGPDLGTDSINAGKKATVYSIIAVVLFMILGYSLFGMFANVSLIFNIFLLMAGLSVLQATLTLPGIAGIALTIGMAVDANVLIYERIREEMRLGKRALSAIDAGFTQAMRTIVDSNLTTLIGALFLFEFGTGPIRGFAVTLALGIVISMFTAVSLTRLIVLKWYQWKNPRELPL